MSFLDNSNSEFLSARVTKKGRNAIANGNFNVSYFQIGDSEYDYSNPFFNLNGIGGSPYQKVMTPFDIESGVKYPYKLDSNDNTTTLGTPVNNHTIDTIRNVMGPAGFVSNYIEYDNINATGTTIACPTVGGLLSTLTGGTSLSVLNGNLFQGCDFITLTFIPFGGVDPNTPVITGQTNSLIYRITGITGNVIGLDRAIPNLSSISGNYQVVCNKCESEYSACESIDYTGQLNAWTLNIVWGQKPMGSDYPILDEDLTGYTSNTFVSAKEFLGYNSTGQTFTDFTGGTLSAPTSFVNSHLEQIEVSPNEQRCLAIIHYSESNDIQIDPERFFKYDDYISYDDGTLGSIVNDQDGNPLTDKEYFEVYIPFLLYHRNTGTTVGAKFFMDGNDYFIKSTKNENHQLLFKYLIDEQGYKVGKIFPNNKLIVFDDLDIVAALDYRSNRRYTLGAPKVGLTPSDVNPENSLLSGSTGQTVWITYMLAYSNTSNRLNSLPCNYYTEIQGINTPSSVTVKFTGNTFQFLNETYNDLQSGYIARRFYLLAQITESGDLPSSDLWRIIEYTTEAGGNGSNFLSTTGLTGVTFTLTKSDYDAANIFDLEDFFTSDYLGSTSSTIEPQFGDEQPFPGSIRCVRATDIEVMNFEVNLPSTQFLETQNPTYTSGLDKKVTEIALLNSNKEALVVAKTAVPVTRTGTQVFSVKIDF